MEGPLILRDAGVRVAASNPSPTMRQTLAMYSHVLLGMQEETTADKTNKAPCDVR